MLKRIITAVVAIAIFLPVLYFSETIVFPIVMALLSLIGCFEMLRCTELIKKYALSVPVLGLSLALPLLPYWYDSETVEHVCLMALIVLALYLFTIMTFSRGKITLANVGSAYLSCFYIIVAFMALCLLRYRVAAGEYVLVNFKSEGAFTLELERVFGITEGILRSIVIRHLDDKKTAKEA